ncbi:autotransporter assembly complex protein TamA [Wenxinia marina]|uniref:Autotransporter secretion outer membrane protein TamA n=1 Tax=Wenxinia marina DSM 24838 TaxID=1123501 RepID=A0A0D0PDU2_9RHOB|nr:BamA/TamA family outer membrane protein [Wenxinia marina]KIQ69601.1 autotransporter secretion outer membrane protein TamA [Wenxinia marina DSM 24838]GGL59664.1 outer membrane protein assembly factor [Wenxinia marina]
MNVSGRTRVATLALPGLLALAGGGAAAQEVTVTLPPGADDDLVSAVENAALTMGLDADDPDVVAQDFIAAARADYRRILTAMYAEGRYGPVVSILVDGREASAIQPLESPDRIGRIDIRVDPGPEFVFGRAEVAPVAEGSDIPEEFRTGEVARAGVIVDAADAAVLGWREAGRPLAEVADDDITALHPQRRVDAAIAIAPGPQLSFGAVTVTGNDAVRTERVRAIAGLPVGEIYSPDAIAAAERRLRRQPAFSAVSLNEATAPGPNQTLPVEIQVVEALPRRIGFGAEIATEDGLTLTAYWLHRNLLGGAEQFRIEGEVTGIGGATGGIDYHLGTEFIRPATFLPDIDLTFRADLDRMDEEDYLADSLTSELTLKWYASDDLELEGGIGTYIVREERDGVELDYNLVTLPLRATFDRRDDDLDARFGYYLDGEVTPFYGTDDTGAGARLYADARAYYSFLAEDRVTLAARVQAGSVVGAGLFDVPSEYLFYSGGGGTVRGQPYQSLGLTTSVDGVEIGTGGASFVGAQLEARVRVTPRIGAVAFYDIGAISADTFPDTDGPWHAGTGIGARYVTPIGPIRVDVGTPASGDDAFEELQLYIGIGQAF